MPIRTLSEFFLEIWGYDKLDCLQEKVEGRADPWPHRVMARRGSKR